VNKRGQFFLIAALVIAGIIITLTTINISTKTSETKTTAVYDLSKEINYEEGSLIDYVVFQATSPSAISASVQALASNYSAENPSADLLIVYGNTTNYNVTLYNKTSTGSVCSTGLTGCSPQSSGRVGTPPYSSIWQGNSKNVTVQLDRETNLTFTLPPTGQDFFIVLKKKVGGETIIAKNPK
jgi:hypothetical protein